MTRINRVGALVLTLALAVAITGCGGEKNESPKKVTTKKGPEVRVGSLLDSEGQVLGSMIIQMLEANGIKTVDKTKFGTPDVVRKALLAGDLDATVDYTGSGQYYVGPEGDALWSDPVKGYETVRSKDAENGLVWLTPADANNSEFFGVLKTFAKKNDLKTMEEFAAYVNAGGEIKLIGDQSWMDSPAGLKAYEKAYGFTLSADQKIGLSNGVTAQFIKAVVDGTDGANVAEVYGTDGGLADMGLVVLEDTKNVPPVYAPTPVFRAEIAEAYPELDDILAPVFESLTLEILQDLNKQVAVDGRNGADVARDYLTEKGFLK